MAKKTEVPEVSTIESTPVQAPSLDTFDREAFWSVGENKRWALPWPEIVTVSGKIGSGKTSLATNVGVPYELIANVDLEKSSTSQAKQMNFGEYVDVQAAMSSSHPKGYTDIELYNFLVKAIDDIPAGKFDILILDNASPLEGAIASFVEKNPGNFGLSANQIARSGGLKWGAVKDYYAQLITRWASKFKMMFIITQLRTKWDGNNVAKDQRGRTITEPKGLETLEMLSSLALTMDIGRGGVPSALVRKCRISRVVWVADPENPPPGVPQSALDELYGEPGPVVIPHLPPRLPKATWPAIRYYMKFPADFSNLRPEEQIPPEQPINEADMLYMRYLISENEKSSNEARLEAEQLRRTGVAAQRAPVETPKPQGAFSQYPRTMDGLMSLAKDLTVSEEDVRSVLRERFGSYNDNRWMEYATAIKAEVQRRAEAEAAGDPIVTPNGSEPTDATPVPEATSA